MRRPCFLFRYLDYLLLIKAGNQESYFIITDSPTTTDRELFASMISMLFSEPIQLYSNRAETFIDGTYPDITTAYRERYHL